MEPKNTQIELVAKPVIKHELQKYSDDLKARIENENIPNLVATTDTVKFLKDMRADFNRESKLLHSDISAVLNDVLAPINEIKEIYKDSLKAQYVDVDNLLKDKIASVENELKRKKLEEVTVYFNELLISEQINFVKIEQVGLNITLTITAKKLKEQCNEFIEKIKDDIALIKTNKFEAEIMAEYKLTLNASKATIDVQGRKHREAEEKVRIKAQEWTRRQSEFKRIGMNFDEATNSFVYDETIYISVANVQEVEKSVFTAKIAELEEKIKTRKKEVQIIENAKIVEEPANTPKVEVEKPVIKEPAAPLSAPKVEKKQDLVQVEWAIVGTMKQLQDLKEYIINNGLTRENL